MITHTRRLNIVPGCIPPIIVLNQYDDDFELVFELYASTGEFVLEEGTTASIRGTKSSGTGYSASCTIDTGESTVTVTGDQQMTAVRGRQEFEITLYYDDKELNSANFYILVEAAALDAETVTDETVLQEITDFNTQIAAAEDAADRAETAQAAAEAAAEEAQQIVGITVDSAMSSTSTNPVQNKVVNAEISALKEDYEQLEEDVNGIITLNYTEGKNISANSVGASIVDDANSCLSELIPVTWAWDSATSNRWYFNEAESDPNYYYKIIFYDENQSIIDYKSSYGTEFRTTTGYDNLAYVRFSFRKGTVGKLTNYANPPTNTYWIASDVVTQNGIVQKVGELNDLHTTDKSNLVGAINELKDDAPALPIVPKDTSFFHISKNLINPSLCVDGEFVNQTNGDFQTLSGQYRTGYIEIEPSTEYVVRRENDSFGANFRYVFYTADKSYISGAVGALPDMLLTSPANAKYIAISDSLTLSSTMIAPYVDGDTSFEAYDNTYVLPKYIIDGDATPEVTITPANTSFFHVSKNLIDPSALVTGEFVNQANGNFTSISGHTRTGYIEVEPSTQYVVRLLSETVGANFRYAFYTSAKTFISGAIGNIADMLLTSPATAKYIAVSNSSGSMNIMIAPYVDGDTSFEAYDNTYVLPKYIIDGDADSVILNLPEKIYALVGFETNIYFDNITEDSSKYTWDCTCTKGMQLERGFRITPTADDVGTYDLTIRASISENIYAEKTVSLIVTSASAGNGETATVIVMGDSTTDNGTVIEKLHEDFSGDVMSVTTLGTRGTSPNNHEGRSGWTLYDYLTKASETYTDGRGTVYNPFYNPDTGTFDADYYFTETGIAKPDYFIINMGINDVFGYGNDNDLTVGINSVIERMNTVVESVLEATTTTKVCVCLTIPPNHSQDAFGKAYSCGQTRNRCKRNNAIWVDTLIEQFSDREDERIYIIPINACLDTVNNMGMETLPVNARNTDVTYQSPIANGGVHPVASGYWQIADVYTAFLKANA